MKTLADTVVVNHLCPILGVRMCPKCGAGTESEYERKKRGWRPGKLIGCVCRECKLIWRFQTLDGNYIITSMAWQPAEKTRIYEIQVVRTEYYIEAETAEEARLKLIEQLAPGDTSKKYGIYVKHMGDHPECNEGIC